MNEQALDDFGAELRRFREDAGLTLREIADETKLSPHTLKALEENRIAHLPGGIYRRAIVRAYASQVGIDPEAAVRAFVARYPDDVPSRAHIEPVREPSRLPRMLRALFSLLGALVPLVAGVMYFGSSSSTWVAGAETPRTLADVMPPVDRASMSDESTPLAALAMLVSVTSRTRVEIIADGREVASGRFDPGEVITLTAADDVVLRADNAGAVHFSINGRAGRTLGAAGSPLVARISRDDYDSFLIR